MKLFDIINNIFYGKVPIPNEDLTDYNPFMVNRATSYYIDTILYGNELNTHFTIPATLQHKILISNISKRKRFSKWFKKEKSDLIEKIMKYYGYSHNRALEVLNLFTADDIKWLDEKLDTGGLRHAKQTSDK
jgi:hypothetical protein